MWSPDTGADCGSNGIGETGNPNLVVATDTPFDDPIATFCLKHRVA